jgi:AraC family transcriptional regulator
MQRLATRKSYAERIDRVLQHIAEDIDRPLGFDELASVACFSPFHFHRIYRGITGETVGETVRRLRLHRAAHDLNATALPMDRIARKAGYGSLAAFSRAFKASYGCPPTEYRQANGTARAHPNRSIKELAVYEIDISDTPGFDLVGLDHLGDYNAIGTTFERVTAAAAMKNLFRPDTRMFGVYYDSPNDVPAAKLRSFAGLTAPKEYEPDGGLRLETVKPGPVACLVHKGPYAELSKAYDYLYGAWLPRSGRIPADRPPFEEYLNNPRELPPTEWLTMVCIPLESGEG